MNLDSPDRMSVNTLWNYTDQKIDEIILDHGLIVPTNMVLVDEIWEDTKIRGGQCVIGEDGYYVRMAYDLYKNRSLKWYDMALEHEVSHAEAFYRYGPTIEPHGKEWEQIAFEMDVTGSCVHYRKPIYLATCEGCDSFCIGYNESDVKRCDHKYPCDNCGGDMSVVLQPETNSGSLRWVRQII